MKTFIVIGIAAGIIYFITRYNQYENERIRLDTPESSVWDEPGNNESLDDILGHVLGDCFEAWCDDCGMVLATGTGPYKPQVANVAYMHMEMYDHNAHVRSWADE